MINLHDGKIFDSRHMIHAELNPYNDVIVDNVVVAGGPGLDTVTTSAFEIKLETSECNGKES